MIAIDVKMPEACLECFACDFCSNDQHVQPYCRLIAYRDRTAANSYINISGGFGRIAKCPLMNVKKETDETEC